MTFKALTIVMIMATTPVTPQSLLDGLRKQTEAFENTAVVSGWTELSKGKPIRWEDQHVYADDLGRFHMTTSSGSFDELGNRKRDPGVADQTSRIFDGEKTVTKNYFSDRDRVGNPAELGSENAGYRTAQVHDGKFPKDGIASFRSPLTFTCNEIVFGLIESTEEGRKVTIAPLDKENGLHVLNLKRTKGREIYGSDRIRALLDPSKGWLPVRVDAIDGKDRLVQRTVCEYAKSSNGYWIPTRGAQLHYADRSVADGPLWETRFEASEIVLNDPNFNESVFQAKLESDTAVSDIRFGVTFRVGDEEIVDSELNRLAKQASELKQDETFEQVYGPLLDQQPSGRSWIITLILTAFPILVVILVIRKYYSSRAFS